VTSDFRAGCWLVALSLNIAFLKCFVASAGVEGDAGASLLGWPFHELWGEGPRASSRLSRVADIIRVPTTHRTTTLEPRLTCVPSPRSATSGVGAYDRDQGVDRYRSGECPSSQGALNVPHRRRFVAVISPCLGLVLVFAYGG